MKIGPFTIGIGSIFHDFLHINILTTTFWCQKYQKNVFLILEIKKIQQVVHYGINMLSMWTHKLDMTNDMLIPTLTKHEPRTITLIEPKQV